MISQTAKYTLQILGYLARNSTEWIGVGRISSSTNIPTNYLTTILNELRKHRFIESQKGWGGGFMLRTSTLEKPIFEIICALEKAEQRPIRHCTCGDPRCSADSPCAMHPYWTKIRKIYHEMIHSLKVSDLVQMEEGIF